MEVLVFRATPRLALLETLIKEIDNNQGLTRSAITIRALDAAKNVNWQLVRDELLALEPRDDIPVPASMQVKIVYEDYYKEIRNNVQTSLGLERLQTPYFITLLWANYLSLLKVEKMRVGERCEKTDLTAPEIVATLVELLLLHREKEDVPTIEKIKEILLAWKKKNSS